MNEEPKPPEPQYQRVVVYVHPRVYRALKAKLAARALSVSEWFRRQVDRLLGQ